MDWHALLGLPLPMALEKLRQAGAEAEIRYSRSPRQQTAEGTPRVVRAAAGRLTACFFPDGDPGDAEE